jgi:hypothetical protein
MGRTLQNDVPAWALVVTFAVVPVLIGLGGMVLVQTRLSAWRAEESSQVVLAVSAIAMTFFALVLALVIVDLYTSYTTAEADVTKESNTLIKLIQDADAFPLPQEEGVRLAVHNYVREVVEQEFPALREGRAAPQSPRQLLQISVALKNYNPETQSQISFYNSAVSQVNDLVAERSDRVSSADSAVPAPLDGLLLVLAAMSLGTTLFLKTHHPGLDVILVLAVSIIIGLGLVTVLILEYPFSGSIAVSDEPFRYVATFSGLTAGP